MGKAVDKPLTGSLQDTAPAPGAEEPPGAEERRRRGVHADVCGHIRNLIVHGELASGERINEVGLSEALGVSRTPIREALKVLAAEGLVELLPNRGSRVTTPSTDEIVNLFAVIAALERLAVETVTLQASAPALARLRALHDELQAAGVKSTLVGGAFGMSRIKRGKKERAIKAAKMKSTLSCFSPTK